MIQNHQDLITQKFELNGKRVLDVGSGDGNLTRFMAGLGATVTGVECSQAQLKKAYAADLVPGSDFVDAFGEDLPFDAESADYVIYFNSLHHVAPENMDAALAEAYRVLKPGGTLSIDEPLAEGGQYEMMKSINDEKVVRAQAYEAIGRAPELGFIPQEEFTYVKTVVRKSFEAFRNNMLSSFPDRQLRFEALEDDIRSGFDAIGEDVEGGIAFHQPVRVNILKKPEA